MWQIVLFLLIAVFSNWVAMRCEYREDKVNVLSVAIVFYMLTVIGLIITVFEGRLI